MLAELFQEDQKNGHASLHVAGAAPEQPVARIEVRPHFFGEGHPRKALFQAVAVKRVGLQGPVVVHADRIHVAVQKNRVFTFPFFPLQKRKHIFPL